jgi:predicted HAD superfamily Cof-like phosphohydrolase
MSVSDAVLVKEFTEATGNPIPDKPQKMNKEQVHFITKMIIDEVKELLATVESPEDYNKFLKDTIDTTKDVVRDPATMSDSEIIAEQHDAFVDIYYYSLNCAAKNGVNLSKIFNIVHESNMAKRDPETGTFLKREDGKVLKPANYIPADVTAEINNQIVNGAF